ncbi:hypothetical protein [Burkholderia stagnalis]|uniref:hypothetical protein n=1 Tax=Burkholderia stagnalis TaxID=1503054 RepID=UPI000F576F98|nr:hypothetical protein [Burkholderia stagnalis]RQQ54282.1 hypothetical protein DF145_05175 [Burkholderia stagnalis]RQY03953.1 hypothetical protein DF121_08235 [Burkholderia stagnalis]RQY21630.1 hypothetical protein DF115_06390 [Burkholderia stagnalis]RQY32163.1 hypothetical protein DF114_11990 [Burkholderia stagnalis]
MEPIIDGSESPKIAENMQIFVDKIVNAGKVFVSLASPCTTFFLVVAAFPTQLDAGPADVTFGFASRPPEISGKPI